MPPASIAHDTYLKCLGLMAIAAEQERDLQRTINTLARELGAEPHGFVDEAVYNHETLRWLLERLGIAQECEP